MIPAMSKNKVKVQLVTSWSSDHKVVIHPFVDEEIETWRNSVTLQGALLEALLGCSVLCGPLEQSSVY